MPEYRTPAAAKTYKAGTRQTPAVAAAIASGQRSWWETVKPGEMTAAATAEEKRMRESKAAKQISSARFSFSD